jgi:hypothetical protein
MKDPMRMHELWLYGLSKYKVMAVMLHHKKLGRGETLNVDTLFGATLEL